jgi:hypothetical protein
LQEPIFGCSAREQLTFGPRAPWNCTFLHFSAPFCTLFSARAPEPGQAVVKKSQELYLFFTFSLPISPFRWFLRLPFPP